MGREEVDFQNASRMESVYSEGRGAAGQCGSMHIVYRRLSKIGRIIQLTFPIETILCEQS